MNQFKVDINSKEWKEVKSQKTELIKAIQSHFIDNNETTDLTEKPFDYRACLQQDPEISPNVNQRPSIPDITMNFFKAQLKIDEDFLAVYEKKTPMPGNKPINNGNCDKKNGITRNSSSLLEKRLANEKQPDKNMSEVAINEMSETSDFDDDYGDDRYSENLSIDNNKEGILDEIIKSPEPKTRTASKTDNRRNYNRFQANVDDQYIKYLKPTKDNTSQNIDGYHTVGIDNTGGSFNRGTIQMNPSSMKKVTNSEAKRADELLDFSEKQDNEEFQEIINKDIGYKKSKKTMMNYGLSND